MKTKISFLTDRNDALKKLDVDFGIKSDSLIPQKITKELGIKPDWSWAKGDLYKSHSGMLEKTSGIWSLTTQERLKSTSAEKHCLLLLKLLSPCKKKIEEYLKKKDFILSIRLTCEYKDFHGGYDLSSKTLQAISSFCHFFYFTNILNDK